MWSFDLGLNYLLALPFFRFMFYVALGMLPIAATFLAAWAAARTLKGSRPFGNSITLEQILAELSSRSTIPPRLVARWILWLSPALSAVAVFMLTQETVSQFSAAEMVAMFTFICISIFLLSALFSLITRQIILLAPRMQIFSAWRNFILMVSMAVTVLAIWLMIAFIPNWEAFADLFGGTSDGVTAKYDVFRQAMKSYWYLTILLPLLVLAGTVLILRRYRETMQSVVGISTDKNGRIALLLRSFSREGDMVRERTPSVFSSSFEGRLAYHFNAFGAFVAVGSPNDNTSYFGAKRVYLDDGEWRQYVKKLIVKASPIVMVYYPTKWVEWELNEILQADRSGHLIVFFMSGGKDGLRGDATGDFDAFTQQLKSTKWSPALETCAGLGGVVSVTLSPTGLATIIRSDKLNNDAYQIASLISHYIVLKD